MIQEARLKLIFCVLQPAHALHGIRWFGRNPVHDTFEFICGCGAPITISEKSIVACNLEGP